MEDHNTIPTEGFPIRADWHIQAICDGEVVQEEFKKNTIVTNGRADVLLLLFGLTGQAPLIALGVGASSTAPTVNDTHLNYEYTQTAVGANRYTLTNTASSLLSASDVVSDTFVDTSETPSISYYKKIVVQATIPTTDPNVGQPFQEYGLFTVVPTPATPSSTSGTMFNHLVSGSAIIKDNTTQIVVIITLRV